MKVWINQIYDYSDRRPTKRARVFVNSNATDLADKWFNENGLWSLDFKSKTWSRLKRLTCKINSRAIAEVLNCCVKDIKYSIYCGCSCPCSPGYNVYNTEHAGKGISVGIIADEINLKPLTDYLKIATLDLDLEIAEQKSK